LTKKDIARLALNEQYTFEQAGVTENDVVQLMLTLDKQFMAGLAYLQGLQNIGCAVVRSGPGSPAFQLSAIARHEVSVLVAVPSFLLRIIEFANTENINLNKLSVKKIICIGEPIRHLDLSPNELAKKITTAWNVQLYGTYASTEMQTAFSECSEHNGGHLAPDLLIAEILDDSGNEVGNGEVGELVITHLGVEGMPLVRYQTGDMVAKLADPCLCGSHTMRLGPVVGRKNQLFKVNGTSIYPTSIFSLLKKFEVSDALLLVSENEMQHQLKLLIDCDENELKPISACLFEQLKVKFEIVKADRREINNYRNPDSRKPEVVVFV
jgi:phenylacetate-CoA ligase